MKKILLTLTCCIVGLNSCKQNVENNKTEEQSLAAVTATAEDFFKALGTGDSTLMRSLLVNDFEMFEHDVVWNTDSLLSLMPKTLGRKWSVRDVSMSQSGSLIHIHYFNQGIVPADRSWFESMLLKASSDGLKIQFMHSTKLYLK